MRLRKLELITGRSPGFVQDMGSVYQRPDSSADHSSYPLLVAFLDKVSSPDMNTLWEHLAQRGTPLRPFYKSGPHPTFLVTEFIRGAPLPAQAIVVYGREGEPLKVIKELGDLAIPGRGKSRESPHNYLSVPPFQGACAYLEMTNWNQQVTADRETLRGIQEFETIRHEQALQDILSGAMSEFTHSILDKHRQKQAGVR